MNQGFFNQLRMLSSADVSICKAKQGLSPREQPRVGQFPPPAGSILAAGCNALIKEIRQIDPSRHLSDAFIAHQDGHHIYTREGRYHSRQYNLGVFADPNADPRNDWMRVGIGYPMNLDAAGSSPAIDQYGTGAAASPPISCLRDKIAHDPARFDAECATIGTYVEFYDANSSGPIPVVGPLSDAVINDTTYGPGSWRFFGVKLTRADHCRVLNSPAHLARFIVDVFNRMDQAAFWK